ncbi:MAG: SH3 domain-containing protein [Chloroflexota bacterium]
MLKQMLRSFLLLVVSLLFIMPLSAQTVDFFTVTSETLNARTGPGIEYDIIGRLGRGATFQILEYSVTENWVLVDLGYAQAWVFRRLGTVQSYNASVVTTNTATVTTQTTTTDASTLGQGGGFAPPVVVPTVTIPTVTETGVDLTVTQTVEEFNSTIGVTNTLRIRFAPNLTSRIIGFIPFDQRATPIGRTANGTWIQVQYEDTVGWVYFLYVAFPPAIDVRELPVTG